LQRVTPPWEDGGRDCRRAKVVQPISEIKDALIPTTELLINHALQDTPLAQVDGAAIASMIAVMIRFDSEQLPATLRRQPLSGVGEDPAKARSKPMRLQPPVDEA